MNIKIQATNLELTGAINDYINKKVGSLEKFVKKEEGSVIARVEVGKINNHHKQGDIFMAEINISMPHAEFRAVSEEEDLYAAIDEVRDQIEREIVSYKDKKRTLFKRGASVVKDIVKGFGKFKFKNNKLPRK